jgi:hypothetical protein
VLNFDLFIIYKITLSDLEKIISKNRYTLGVPYGYAAVRGRSVLND